MTQDLKRTLAHSPLGIYVSMANALK